MVSTVRVAPSKNVRIWLDSLSRVHLSVTHILWEYPYIAKYTRTVRKYEEVQVYIRVRRTVLVPVGIAILARPPYSVLMSTLYRVLYR